jgi:tetratricopeptide (TPR) repeat protein
MRWVPFVHRLGFVFEGLRQEPPVCHTFQTKFIMFHFQKHIRQPLLSALLGLGSIISTPAWADITDACFNFLQAQDYPRARTEAQTLLKNKGLAREDERAAQLCLGRALSYTGDSRQALPSLLRVEALSRSTQELAVAYNWLGLTYDDLNDLDRAELYQQRALKAFKALGDKSMEATTLNNLGLLANRRGDQDRALQLYRESLALELNEAKKATTLSNIAMIHSDRQEYAEAVKLRRQALDLARSSGDAHLAAMLQLNLGNALHGMGTLEDAEVALRAGLKAIQLLGDKAWEANAFIYLAWLEEKRNNPAAAKDWYQKAQTLYRSVGNTSAAQKMADEIAALQKGAAK